MSANAESEAQGGIYIGDEKACWKYWVLRYRWNVSGQLQERRAGGREFQI